MAKEKTKAESTAAQKPISKEDAAKRRAEITKFYKDNITHLKVQLEYEKLMTEIEQSRVARIQAQMFLAQAYADPDNEPEEATQARKEFSEATNGLKKNFRPLKTN